jgi:hypothetical protein
MQRWATSEESFFGLLRDLRQETVDLVRQEIRLAKTEVSEKTSCFARNAAALVLGGFVAYAGVLALLVGLGFLLTLLFVKMGMEQPFAEVAGLGIIGVIVSLVGIALVTKAVTALSNGSLTPEKTVETLRELKGDSTLARAQFGPQDNRSSEQIQAHIETTRERVQATASEITERLKPRSVGRQVVHQARSHPGVTAAVGFSTGVLTFLLARRRHRAKICR